jgi:hypothetical protein
LVIQSHASDRKTKVHTVTGRKLAISENAAMYRLKKRAGNQKQGMSRSPEFA